MRRSLVCRSIKNSLLISPSLWLPQSKNSGEVASDNSRSPSGSFFCSPKIVCTIGPASCSQDVLREMMSRRCVNVCRLNFSHGSHDDHRRFIAAIREAAQHCGVEDGLCIALDTKGPEIRTARNAGNRSIRYDTGQRLIVRAANSRATEDSGGSAFNTPDTLFVEYAPLVDQLSVGSVVLIADGMLELVVEAKVDGALHARVVFGNLSLSGSNNVHLPRVDVQLPAVSEKDILDVEFGVREGIDMVFASLTRGADHVVAIRDLLSRFDSNTRDRDVSIPIVAKIENEQGLRNIDEIIAQADGVMVARGDLGVEIPMSEVFLAQKMITARCNVAGKPVICATQMLESMTEHPRPTRAEASDVANAVIDGVDAVMLSSETASGKYPLEAATFMRAIAQRASRFQSGLERYNEVMEASEGIKFTDVGSIASAAVLASMELGASLIVTTTVSGRSVRMLAKFRPTCPIVAVCRTRRCARSLAMVRGVVPLCFHPGGDSCSVLSREQWVASFAELIEFGVRRFRETNAHQASPNALDRLLCVVTNTDAIDDQSSFRCSMSVRWM